MGIVVSIYKDNSGDCSKNGVSNRFEELTITNVEGPFEPTEKAPAAKLVVHSYSRGHAYIVPDECENVHSMFGGAFAYTSDGRFSEKLRELTGNTGSFAVQIHDRVEPEDEDYGY